MKRGRGLLCAVIVLIPMLCHGQNEFEDFILTSTHCVVLEKSGKITAWDLHSLNRQQILSNDTINKICSIAKNGNGQIFAGTEKGIIYEIGPNLVLRQYLTIKYYPVRFLFFNSENELFVIVPNAVYDPVKKQHWTRFKNHTEGLIHKKKVLGIFSVKSTTYFQMPEYVFLDSKDRIWMTAAFGEFGGDLQIFDTKNRTVINHKQDSIRFGAFSPKSIFEGNNGEVFITSGLQHMMNFGEIFKIESDLDAVRIFQSTGLRKVDRKTKTVLDEGGLFVGPGAFNSMERSITFATDRGIHKATVNGMGQLEKPVLLFKPELTWTQEPLAVGASMAIKKMEYTSDGKLIFLTKKDGIGIYDGKSVTMLK